MPITSSICSAVSIQYRLVTDGQTDTVPYTYNRALHVRRAVRIVRRRVGGVAAETVSGGEVDVRATGPAADVWKGCSLPGHAPA